MNSLDLGMKSKVADQRRKWENYRNKSERKVEVEESEQIKRFPTRRRRHHPPLEKCLLRKLVIS